MRTSLYHKTKVVSALATTSISSSTTTNGATVDLQQTTGGDWRAALLIVRAGTITDGTYALSVEDSANASSWAAVTASDSVQGPSGTITATNGTAEISYTGNKRYCRVVITSTDVTTGGSLAGVAVLSGSAAHKR